MLMLAQCATFDPDPEAFLGLRLPVDPHTCEVIEERWANWLRWDPDAHGGRPHASRALSGGSSCLYIDCGDIDQYNLVYGARILHRKLEAAGVPHIYEEFHDDHSSVDYRMDRSLPLLAAALCET